VLQRGILRWENPIYTYWRSGTAARRGFQKDSLSHQIIFVGGTCTLPSVLLVQNGMAVTLPLLFIDFDVGLDVGLRGI